MLLLLQRRGSQWGATKFVFVVGYILVMPGQPFNAPAELAREHRSCVGFDLTARHFNPHRLEQVPRLRSSSLRPPGAEVGYC
ncbi:MAG: hypothetical protein J2P31_14960 [Blastocatellia bacterium]|nr:hypothetical protein [Blastocatellia bacterium]